MEELKAASKSGEVARLETAIARAKKWEVGL